MGGLGRLRSALRGCPDGPGGHHGHRSGLHPPHSRQGWHSPVSLFRARVGCCCLLCHRPCSCRRCRCHKDRVALVTRRRWCPDQADPLHHLQGCSLSPLLGRAPHVGRHLRHGCCPGFPHLGALLARPLRRPPLAPPPRIARLFRRPLLGPLCHPQYRAPTVPCRRSPLPLLPRKHLYLPPCPPSPLLSPSCPPHTSRMGPLPLRHRSPSHTPS